MPTFAEICAYLDTLFPPSLAEPWDRDGPAVDPCPAREVTAAVVALDVTSPAIEYAIAIGAQCIVTHHPLLFKLPDALRADESVGGRVLALARAGIAAVSCHTRLDSASGGVNDCLVRALGFYGSERPEDYLRLCDLSPRKAGEMLDRVRKTISPQAVFYGKTDRWISRAAVSCGAGGEFAAQAAALGAELFITGEMKHNERIEAQGLGMSVLLLGHGESESPVLEPLAQRLREKLSVPVRIYDERNL